MTANRWTISRSAFFGVDNGSYVTKTYTFDDVVAALNGVAKYDWAGFLRAHVDALDPPLQDGLARHRLEAGLHRQGKRLREAVQQPTRSPRATC